MKDSENNFNGCNCCSANWSWARDRSNHEQNQNLVGSCVKGKQ